MSESGPSKICPDGFTGKEYIERLHSLTSTRRMQCILDKFLKNSTPRKEKQAAVELAEFMEILERGWFTAGDLAKYYTFKKNAPKSLNNMYEKLVLDHKSCVKRRSSTPVCVIDGCKEKCSSNDKLCKGHRSAIVPNIPNKQILPPVNWEDKEDLDRYFQELLNKEAGVKELHTGLVQQGFGRVSETKSHSNIIKKIKSQLIKEEKRVKEDAAKEEGFKGKVKKIKGKDGKARIKDTGTPTWLKAKNAANYHKPAYHAMQKKLNDDYKAGRHPAGKTANEKADSYIDDILSQAMKEVRLDDRPRRNALPHSEQMKELGGYLKSLQLEEKKKRPTTKPMNVNNKRRRSSTPAVSPASSAGSPSEALRDFLGGNIARRPPGSPGTPRSRASSDSNKSYAGPSSTGSSKAGSR